MKALHWPRIPGKLEWITIISGAVYFIAAYTLLGFCPLMQALELPLTKLDEAVPLIPWTVLVYFSDYGFLLWALLSARADLEFTLCVYRLLLVSILSFSVFLLFPTVYPRFPVPEASPFGVFYLWIHALDQPTNCFPSLHVSMTLTAAVTLLRTRPQLRVFVSLWTLAICLSTMTTKQHYAIDVIGGAFVALASVWAIKFVKIRQGSAERRPRSSILRKS